MSAQKPVTKGGSPFHYRFLAHLIHQTCLCYQKLEKQSKSASFALKSASFDPRPLATSHVIDYWLLIGLGEWREAEGQKRLIFWQGAIDY